MLTRKSKLLSKLGDQELVLELGPLHEPIAETGKHNVRYVDRMSHQELVEHYEPQGIPVSKIVPLDHVWPPGEDLVSHIPSERFNYCIASHVIEHVPNLIEWLNQIASVMNTGGILSLAIPNREHTFDRERPLTTTAEIIESEIMKANRPTPKQVYCHFRNNVDPQGNNTETIEFALHAARQAAAEVYVDVHCWVFNMRNFDQSISELADQNLIQFRLIESSDGTGEFFAKLQLNT